MPDNNHHCYHHCYHSFAYIVISRNVVVAVEGNANYGNCSEESISDMPDLNSIIDDRMNDELLKDDTDCNENGDNGQHGDILE